MDHGEKKALDDIQRHGCHVIHVLEEGDLPPFSYSVGIQRTSRVPEVIVIGLDRDVAHFVVNEYNRRVKTGENFSRGQSSPGFIEGFEVKFETVGKAHYRAYLGWDRWLYDGDEFDVLQIVYPTIDGVWPWDLGASATFKARQPLLT